MSLTRPREAGRRQALRTGDADWAGRGRGSKFHHAGADREQPRPTEKAGKALRRQAEGLRLCGGVSLRPPKRQRSRAALGHSEPCAFAPPGLRGFWPLVRRLRHAACARQLAVLRLFPGPRCVFHLLVATAAGKLPPPASNYTHGAPLFALIPSRAWAAQPFCKEMGIQTARRPSIDERTCSDRA